MCRRACGVRFATALAAPMPRQAAALAAARSEYDAVRRSNAAMSRTKRILLSATVRARFLPVILIAGLIALAPALGQPVEISQAGEHADWPAAAFAPSGDLWVAWTAYDGKVADQVRARRRAGGEWQDIVTVSPRAGDFLKASIAVQPDGRVWIAWSAQVDGNFDVYARSWHDGRWDPMERLTSDPQPDIHHSLQAASDGKLHLVWQSFRTGDANVYLKTRDGSRWSSPIAITTHEANDWEPATALDGQDRLYIVYDSYRHGDYDVMLRVLEGSELSPEYPIADSPDFEARASVAIDGDGRAWIAWDNQGPNWALDMPSWTRASNRGDWGEPAPWSVEGSVGRLVSLRYTQKIGVAVFAGGQRWTPTGSIEDAMSDQFALSYEIPQMTIDPSGTPRLFLRRWVSRDDDSGMKERPGAWNVHAMTYSGSEWSDPVMLEHSSGSNDQRVAVATSSEGGTWVAYPSDDRWSPGGPVTSHSGRGLGKIRVAPIDRQEPSIPALDRMADSLGERPYATTAWTDRRHTIAAGEKRYSLYWGDLHRHTEISSDGGFDGTLWDMYRYALDAAELDFIASTDHFYGAEGELGVDDARGYDWWRTQKLADAFHVRDRFAPLFGYERSIRWPYGHRNVINLERGTTAIGRTVPRDRENPDSPREPDELRIWEKLRGQDAITIPHTIAAGGGTDFSFNDPALEPLLEIYQGCRMSYEAAGAPRVNSNERYADGFARSALDKGYKLGFIASSDHRSTHISYAAVYAEERTREGIFRALQRRHAYAATDNIVLDVRVGEAIMGDVTVTRDKPVVRVAVRGTGPIHNIQIIKDNAHVYSANPGQRIAAFSFRDADAVPGESYYYVRVQQEDGQMAWASPIWVEYQPQ